MVKKTAKIGMFIALAMIFSYIEAIIPINFGIPGIKLGIANIVVVTSLYVLGFKETIGISLIRILLMGILFGNVFSFIYSLSGGILSLMGMIICKKFKLFSTVGVSVVGGILHNLGQLIAASIVLNNLSIAYYFSVLLISGVVTGFVIGIVSTKVIKILTSPKMKVFN